MSKKERDTIPDYIQEARDLAKAERELGIEDWTRITIGYRNEKADWVKLYQYDFPTASHDRYRWIIRWRVAKLQCENPRFYVNQYCSRYDRRTELRTDYNSCLGQLRARKANITKALRNREEHIASMTKKYPMFYNPDDDTELKKFDEKVARNREICHTLENNIRRAVKSRKTEQFSNKV